MKLSNDLWTKIVNMTFFHGLNFTLVFLSFFLSFFLCCSVSLFQIPIFHSLLSLTHYTFFHPLFPLSFFLSFFTFYFLFVNFWFVSSLVCFHFFLFVLIHFYSSLCLSFTLSSFFRRFSFIHHSFSLFLSFDFLSITSYSIFGGRVSRITVFVRRYGHRNLSSNPRQGCLHFT